MRKGRGWIGFSTIALAVVALGGCASAPVPSLDPSPSLPTQWRNAAAQVPAAAPVDLHDWWRAFDDEQLNALVDRAATGNLDIAQAVERMHAARTLAGHADDRYLPYLRARTDDLIDPDASASFFVAGLDATWEFGLFGKSTGAKRATRGQLDSADADIRAAQVSVVAEVVRNWIELRTAQQREQLQLQIRDARRQSLELTQVREQLHLAAPQSQALAQVQLAQAEAALAEPRAAIDASAQQLAVLLGQNEPDASWLQPGPQPELGNWQLPGAPAELLRTRPEIARAEADVLRTAGELGLARAEMYPNIGFGASMLWSTDILSHRRHSTTTGIASIGPVLDIPLFDWGMRAANAHAKRHELKAVVMAYQQSVLQGVAEVETALGNLEQQRLRQEQSGIAWDALQRIDSSVQSRVQLGLASKLERQEALISAHQAAIELADARASRDLAYVALYKALGGAPMPKDTSASAATATTSTAHPAAR
jgi:multidrug efflux system outer membrane protein